MPQPRRRATADLPYDGASSSTTNVFDVKFQIQRSAPDDSRVAAPRWWIPSRAPRDQAGHTPTRGRGYPSSVAGGSAPGVISSSRTGRSARLWKVRAATSRLSRPASFAASSSLVPCRSWKKRGNRSAAWRACPSRAPRAKAPGVRHCRSRVSSRRPTGRIVVSCAALRPLASNDRSRPWPQPSHRAARPPAGHGRQRSRPLDRQ